MGPGASARAAGDWSDVKFLTITHRKYPKIATLLPTTPDSINTRFPELSDFDTLDF